jgi:hypothetical protein
MAVYDEPLNGYVRSPQPTLPGSEKQWLERELQRLEAVIRELIAAIQELRTENP